MIFGIILVSLICVMFTLQMYCSSELKKINMIGNFDLENEDANDDEVHDDE